MSTKYRYSLAYVRDNAPVTRTFHRSVVAADADEARRMVALLDIHYLSTVKSPQRRAAVIVEAGK